MAIDILTREDLVAWAGNNNFIITSDQIQRWHKRDVLPRPKRISLGRGKGFKSSYPEETKEQLLRVCELLRETRNLEHVRFTLWLERYPIVCEAIRDTLESKGLQEFKNAIRSKGKLLETAWKNERQGKRIRRQLTKHTGFKSKGLSDETFFDLIEQLSNAQSGQTPLYEDSLAEERGEITAAVQVAKVTGIDKLWAAAEMDESLEDAIGEAADSMTLKDYSNALKKSTDTELVQAREDFLFLRDELPKVSSEIIKALSGEILQIFGLSNSEQIAKDQPLARTAGLILMLLTLRKKEVPFIDLMRMISKGTLEHSLNDN